MYNKTIGKVLQIDKEYKYDFLILDIYKDKPEAPGVSIILWTHSDIKY